MGKKLTPEQIPPDAPVIPTTVSSFRDIREGQAFGLVCKKCGKTQYIQITRKNIFIYEAKRQCEMSHGVEIWSENECLPYIQYVEETYGKSFLPKLRLESIKKRNEIVSQI